MKRIPKSMIDLYGEDFFDSYNPDPDEPDLCDDQIIDEETQDSLIHEEVFAIKERFKR